MGRPPPQPAKGRGEPLTHDLELHGLLGLQVGQVDGADVGPLVAHLSALQLQRDVAAPGVQKQPGPLLRHCHVLGSSVIGQDHLSGPAMLVAPLDREGRGRS